MCNLFPGAQNEGTNVARDLPEFNGTTKQGALEISLGKVIRSQNEVFLHLRNWLGLGRITLCNCLD